MTILDPLRTADFIKTFLAQYDEGGLLPVWELCSNETFCMIGYHSVSVIADAIAKRIGGFDKEKALRAMIASAEQEHFGLSHYRTFGYVPGEKESESVSKTLEYAYDDWCIARTAEKLGEKKIAARYYQRSQQYRNVFDPAAGFMRGKKYGMWSSPFSPASVSLDFTEANSWQYSFFVPHDIGGMISLYRGRKNFIAKLDELFTTSAALEGRQQSDITGLIGQYAHGNEPSHHMAYLFTYAGAPSKTQHYVRQILNDLYSPAPDGLSGNEDCGQMSAWYVMSAMGFYQVTPGLPEYVLTASLFDTVTILLQNNKRFSVFTQRTTPADRYIRSIQMNGKEWGNLFFSHDDIVRGSSLSIQLEPTANDDFPFSDRIQKQHSIPFTAVPFFSSPGLSFSESLTVSIGVTEPNTDIYYTTDGSLPTTSSGRYLHPITIIKETTLRAIAHRHGIYSAVAEATFRKLKRAGTISLGTKYSDQYTGGGDDALIDGMHGVEDFRVGHWQGYEGVDLDATIDLGTLKHVDSIRGRFLHDNNAWIFVPSSVTFEVSSDGISYETVFSGPTGISPELTGAHIVTVGKAVNSTVRYVHVRALNIGVCPDWHKGRGGKAWLFVDEIETMEWKEPFKNDE